MDFLKPLILGVIQGLTEFLPVSSSGHLEIGKALLWDGVDAEESMMMTVVLHAATALSTLVVFRQDVTQLLRGLFTCRWSEDAAFLAKIVISMVPAAIVGITLDEEIEALFRGGETLHLVGAMLWLTGILLFLAGRAKSTDKEVGYLHALVIGIAQAVAILPGVSRSGATISTSVLLGIDRAKAARFSFLMVVPLIFGKMAKDLLDAVLEGHSLSGGEASGELVIGFVAAFVTGVLACKWMITLVKNFQLWWFSLYCFAMGTLCIGFWWSR